MLGCVWAVVFGRWGEQCLEESQRLGGNVRTFMTCIYYMYCTCFMRTILVICCKISYYVHTCVCVEMCVFDCPPVAEHTRIITLEEFPAYVNEMHKDRDQGYEEEYRVGWSTQHTIL